MRKTLMLFLIVLLAGCSNVSLSKCRNDSSRYTVSEKVINDDLTLILCVRNGQKLIREEKMYLSVYVYIEGVESELVGVTSYPPHMYKDDYHVADFNVPYSSNDAFENFPANESERLSYIEKMVTSKEIFVDEPYIYYILIDDISDQFPAGVWEVDIDIGVFTVDGYLRMTETIEFDLK